MGVPSSMSTPRTCRLAPSRRSNSTVVKAIGLGRSGDRVANTPWVRLSEGGVAVSSNPWLRSNSHMTIKCEKPSMSASPELRQDFEYAVGVVFRAQSFGNFAGVFVRTADESDGTRSKHGLRSFLN